MTETYGNSSPILRMSVVEHIFPVLVHCCFSYWTYETSLIYSMSTVSDFVPKSSHLSRFVLKPCCWSSEPRDFLSVFHLLILWLSYRSEYIEFVECLQSLEVFQNVMVFFQNDWCINMFRTQTDHNISSCTKTLSEGTDVACMQKYFVASFESLGKYISLPCHHWSGLVFIWVSLSSLLLSTSLFAISSFYISGKLEREGYIMVTSEDRDSHYCPAFGSGGVTTDSITVCCGWV